MRISAPKPKLISGPAAGTTRNGSSDSVPARRLAIGAEAIGSEGAHFRVWAPNAQSLSLELCSADTWQEQDTEIVRMEPDEDRYYSARVPQAKAGMLYRYRFDTGSFPDPASRFQPQGPHGPSEIIDPCAFKWTDEGWAGVRREGQVIYEMHVGTFTAAGTWAAAMQELPELARLGVTVLEVMPVADFPGTFGWGYDGVNMFAPTRLYGRPDDMRAFVDRAHALGLGVILDVVYNHFGPDGNYMLKYSKDYYTDKYENEWGEPINFDGPHSKHVREFFVANARYWVSEFHLDGLRLDATQQIFDASERHILAEISDAIREAAPGRPVYLVGENEPQETRLIRPVAEGGYGLDSLWNDDFHHSARVALTGRNEAYYTDYRGNPQEFISALKYGYLYQGQWYSWQKKQRGTPASEAHPCQFVIFLENHDQAANSLYGARIHQLTDPGTLRAMTCLMLLGPGTPMLFQGQEFAASSPFLYFADHKPDLACLVAKGRKEFLRQFPSIASPQCVPVLADPAEKNSFLKSKLDLSERDKHAGIYRLHCDLLKLRHEDEVFSNPRVCGMDGAVLADKAFVLRFFGNDNHDRLLLVNLGVDLTLSPAPEPLLAPPVGFDWELMWSSEDPKYDGCGIPTFRTDAECRLPGHSALVLKPVSPCEFASPNVAIKEEL